jgi:predicted restriction endonuclease
LDTPNTKVVSKFSKIRKKSDLKKKSKIEQKNQKLNKKTKPAFLPLSPQNRVNLISFIVP